MKITKTTLKEIGTPERETWVWDSTVPGFGLRVWPSGRAVYVLRYRTSARTQRKITIGNALVMHPDEARDRARAMLVQIKAGKDPQAAVVKDRHCATVAALTHSYLDYIKNTARPNTYKATRISFSKHIVPEFGKIKLTELRLETVARWHAKHPHKSAANQAAKKLSAALNWAVDIMEWLPKNPLNGLRYHQEVKRQHILTPAEMRALLAAIEQLNSRTWAMPYLFKLLLITGLRLREWADAEWSQYSEITSTLHLPELGSKTGARTVQIGDDARMILRQMRAHPQCHERWMFPNAHNTRPLTHQNQAWKWVLEKAGIPRGVRIHDLRHTYATYSLQAGASIRDVQQMLGHSKITTTSRYLGVFDDAVKRAQTRSGRAILQIATTGEFLPDDNVQPIRGAVDAINHRT